MDTAHREPRTWFITEAGSGTALALVKAAADRGDNVVALVADAVEMTTLPDTYDGRLQVIVAAVGDPARLGEAVSHTIELFGRIDVVVNTAFYAVPAAVEEIGQPQAQLLFDRTVFGTLNVLRATLPVLRAQKFGHVVQASPSYSQKPAPGTALLTATIYATEGLIDVLTAELAPLGIHVTLVETPPTQTQGIYGKDLSPTESITDYDATVRAPDTAPRPQSLRAAGDDSAVGAIALLAAVDAREPPSRLMNAEKAPVAPALHLGTGAGSRSTQKVTAATPTSRCPTMATTPRRTRR
jgi:NAD(P)-dependent dehydrogenase (short-subunit alcohol dehydrogenase family)